LQIVFGNQKQGLIQMYPDDSIQGILFPTPWWVKDSNLDYKRGRLVKFFAPHVDQSPFTLISIGRNEATEHNTAHVKITPLDVRSVIRYPKLPVAALPQYKKELRAVYRAKKRPGLIVCSGGYKIDRILTEGKAKWQTSRTVIVAPYYGADEGEKRSGFRPEFVKRIRRCEYPQYMWDLLPINGSTEDSVMRLDHLQPVGRSQDSMELLDYCLSDDALLLFDEWLEWLLKGSLETDTMFGELREELINLP